jgi:hypothetical protein
MLVKKIHYFLLCCLFLFNTSCITKYLWSDEVYYETINQFLLGADGRYVVLIGPDYHYILTDERGIFQKILALKQENTLWINPEKSYLKLDENNEIKGYLTIDGPFGLLPVEDAGTLMSLGFRPNKKDEVTIKIELSGRRYSARYLGQAIRANTSYKIPIRYYDSSTAKDIGKAAITPITVGVDAVLLIGKIIILPFELH